jgi:hypothetical protein
MMAIFLFQQSVRSISRFSRALRRAEREKKPERDAALVLRFERPADVAERPLVVREDVPDRAHEQDVQRCRLHGEGFRQDGCGARLSFDRLRHRRSLPADYI